MIVLALGLAIFLPSLSGAPLLDWDEATYAEVAHEANASHDFADFTWNGAPYVKKPPLLFWATAASFRALGESEFSARLPCALFALGTMLVLYFSGLWAAGRLVGTVAALIPLGFYFFVARGGRECATDAPLIFFSSLAMYVTLKARANRWWTCIAGAAVGLAILSKGAAGLIPAITLGIAIFVLPGFSSIGVGGLAIFVVSASVVAAPWYMHSALHNPLFWKSFVQHETLARLSAHLEDEFQPASFTVRTYLDQIAFLWPIVIGLVAALAPRAKDRIERRTLTAMLRGDTGAAVSIWTLWLAVALTAAIIVQTRLGWYILPALIPTALIAAATLGSMLLQQGAYRGYRIAGALVALILIAIQLPGKHAEIQDSLADQRSKSAPTRTMALKARDTALAHGGEGELYFAGVELPTLVYYSGLHCNFVKPEELLETGGITDQESAPVSIGYHDLMYVGPDGDAEFVSNLETEWGVTPDFTPTNPGAQPQPPAVSMSSEL